LIVELVGPAGAGKTAVMHALGRRDATVRPGLRIDRYRHLPLIVGHALPLVPTGLELFRNAPRSWWQSFLLLVRLATLHAVLQREAGHAYRAVILDEGPVFTLTRLRVFEEASFQNARFARCWRAALEQWAATLDVVIWLDAPDHVLTERIRSRPKAHRVKQRSDQAIGEFLARYRRAYRLVLDQMATAHRIRLVEISTTTESADQIAAAILPVLTQVGTAGLES
jgi:deoxyadenosine/deoxycytidine kinase